MLEHSSASFRFRDCANVEVRATSRYSAAEVRHLLAEHRGVPPAIDLRALGCSTAIFEQMLEWRSVRIANAEGDRIRRENAKKIAAKIAAEEK